MSRFDGAADATQSLRLQLTDTFPCQTNSSADLFESEGLFTLKSESKSQNAGISLVDDVQEFHHHAVNLAVSGLLFRSDLAGVRERLRKTALFIVVRGGDGARRLRVHRLTHHGIFPRRHGK